MGIVLFQCFIKPISAFFRRETLAIFHQYAYFRVLDYLLSLSAQTRRILQYQMLVQQQTTA